MAFKKAFSFAKELVPASTFVTLAQNNPNAGGVLRSLQEEDAWKTCRARATPVGNI